MACGHNDFVFLQEADSVRRSIREIELGQWAIFTEVVWYGHIVVLSFNQITDSYTLMSMLMNPTSMDAVLELFRLGWLQVNAYGSNYTMADYISNAISRATGGEGSFLFSWLPVKKEETALLELIQQSISSSNTAVFSRNRYPSSDKLSILKSKIKQMKKDSQATDSKKRELNNLEREVTQNYGRRMHNIGEFVFAMVQLSASSPVIHPPKAESKIHYDYQSLLGIMLSDSSINWDELGIPRPLHSLIENALEQLRGLSDQTIGVSRAPLKYHNNRTDWTTALIQLENKLYGSQNRDCLKMANALIDLCYHYSLEETVSHVLKHFEVQKLKDVTGTLSEDDISYFKEDIIRKLFVCREARKIIYAKNFGTATAIPQDISKLWLRYMNASKLFHSKSFLEDFAHRLIEVWTIHSEYFLAIDTDRLLKYYPVRYRNLLDYRVIDCPESNEGILHIPNWKLALRVVGGQPPRISQESPKAMYEERMKNTRSTWFKRCLGRCFGKLLGLMFSFVFILFLAFSETLLDKFISLLFYLHSENSFLISALFTSASISLMAILIPILFKWISGFMDSSNQDLFHFKIPDILDFYKEFVRFICDRFTLGILYRKKYRSYHREQNSK